MHSIGFYSVVTIWLLFCTFFGGAIVLAVSPGIGYVNAAFLATSAWGGTGLYSVEARDISPGGFVVLYILMYCGGTCTLLLPPMFFRRFSYSKLRPELLEFLKTDGTSNKPIAKSLVEVVNQCEMIHRALAMTILLVLLHIFLWLCIGTFIMYGINTMYSDPAELVSKGYSKLWVSAYIAATGFFNCGFVLTSDSLFQYLDKQGIYLWCTVLILAGNTCAPLCLRVLLKLMHASADALRLDKPALRFALDNPRLMTTHLFSTRQTVVLTLFVIAVDLSEFVFFLASELDRPEMQASRAPSPRHRPRPHLARAAGVRRHADAGRRRLLPVHLHAQRGPAARRPPPIQSGPTAAASARMD